MAFLNCFCASWRNKDKGSKGQNRCSTPIENSNNAKTLQVKLEHLQTSPETFELRSSSFSVPVPFHVPKSSSCNIKVTNHDSPLAADRGEVYYEGGDEHEDTLQMKRHNSDFDLVSYVVNSNEEMNGVDFIDRCDKIDNVDIEEVLEVITSGHVSDPGTGKAEFFASPKLKRSCSDCHLILRKPCQELEDHLHPAKSKSYEDMQRLIERFRQGIFEGDATSPVTVMTQRSADRVILKKHSSSQILPSGSRRLWWKLFLWSHRNLHRSSSAKPQASDIMTAINLQGGYSSDTIEAKRGIKSSKFGLPGSSSGEMVDIGDHDADDQRWDGIYGVSGMWPQNQWVAFPTQSCSPLARVDEWVKEISVLPLCLIENDDYTEDGFDYPPSPDNGGKSPSGRPPISIPEDISHANMVIQSLNASSTVAHMTGIQLKIIPSISHFTSLRSVNLSGNLIAHMTPGSLPKGLHVLNLSRNKINTIEGLRELTRLRVIDLSYNRISRIGQGLSNCTLVKELYLAGNKVSHVEGLHRLLKLTVLDLSFNKITTTKALGQLVANYNSLIALNLLGNLIHSNIGDDQLRKTVSSILPKLAFLNKQPINPQKAREIGTDAISKAILGDSSRNKRRKATTRVGQATSSSISSRRRSSAIGAQTSSRLKSRSRS